MVALTGLRTLGFERVAPLGLKALDLGGDRCVKGVLRCVAPLGLKAASLRG